MTAHFSQKTAISMKLTSKRKAKPPRKKVFECLRKEKARKTALAESLPAFEESLLPLEERQTKRRLSG